jgi:hypothetical protein
MKSGDAFESILPDGGDVFRTKFHDESPVEAVVRALSAIEGCRMTDVPPLYQYVDPDSMNRMMETARDSKQDVTLRLTVEEYDVSIDSDGTITVCAAESGSDADPG